MLGCSLLRESALGVCGKDTLCLNWSKLFLLPSAPSLSSFPPETLQGYKTPGPKDKVFYTKFLPLIIWQGEVVRVEFVLLGFFVFLF